MTPRGSPTLLPWIVAFKALKAALLAALGVALLLAIHRDAVDLVIAVALAVHLPLSSGLFDRMLALAYHATPKKELGAALAAFAYAIVLGTEGVGLYLRRSWARWYTIGVTSSLIPIEVYEIVREAKPARVLIFALNVAIVVYLWRRPETFARG
jgi:uncharacterized membrane protein (DUF2068 family)